MPCRKSLPPDSGSIIGLLLFLALLAAQLNNAFFNSNFQKTAVGKLNIYERVIAHSDQSSETSGNTPFAAAIKKSITPELFKKNVNSLIDGLIAYISGHTNKLPDLYITGSDKLSIASSAGIAPASIEKINLQLIMMFSDEQNFSNSLSVISLVQFILSYLPAFFLLLCAAFTTAVFGKNRDGIINWISSSVLSFFLLCWLTALFLSSIPWSMRLPGLLDPVIAGVLNDYIRYLTGSISKVILLSGLVVFLGVEAALYLNMRLCGLSAVGSLIHPYGYGPALPSYFIKKRKLSVTEPDVTTAGYISSPRGSGWFLPTTLMVCSFLAYILISNAYGAYTAKNLDHAVSYVLGRIGYSSFTDARNEDVCLMELRVLDTDKLPVRNLQVTVNPLNMKKEDNDLEEKGAISGRTDNSGTALFLLAQGDFRLGLNTSGMQDVISPLVRTQPSYDFSLATPGRTVISITLENSQTSSVKISDSSIQYIP